MTTISPSISREDAAERTARYLAMLRNLSELGMALVERFAEEAGRELSEASAQEETLCATNARLGFVRLSRAVCDIIALEARVAAGEMPAAGREEYGYQADPRRPGIMEWLHTEIAASHRPRPERTALERQVEDRVTQLLNDDPGLALPGAAIVHAICEEYGVTFNLRTMPEELLLRHGQPNGRSEDDEDFDDYEDDEDDEDKDVYEAEFSL